MVANAAMYGPRSKPRNGSVDPGGLIFARSFGAIDSRPTLSSSVTLRESYRNAPRSWLPPASETRIRRVDGRFAMIACRPERLSLVSWMATRSNQLSISASTA